MEFRILGPLEVRQDGHSVELPAAKPQALLGVLALHAGEVVPAARLVDELWGEAPPATAGKLIQGYVSALRKALGPGTIVTRGRGYVLDADPQAVDAARFERLAAAGETALAADPAGAEARLAEALALWSGAPLEGLEVEGPARGELERLTELRLAALEDRLEAGLALGRHAGLVGELRTLAAAHPYRERPRALLMLALYRSGRHADALAVYRETHRLLDDELGLEPSARLQRLERRILAQDPELDLPAAKVAPPAAAPPAAAEPPAIAPAPPRRDLRRLVTVLSLEVAGLAELAERLDPEVGHRLLDGCAELCAAAVERHRGTLADVAGGTAIALFGADEVHEDDALRAARAAVELRARVAELAAEVEREHGAAIVLAAGLEAGEVFIGAGTRRGAFATGGAIAAAARLRAAAAAEAGGVLVGESVRRLVGPGTLVLDGRAPAWRLRELRDPASAPARAPRTPFVARAGELAALRAALRDALAASACRMVTVVGLPGIGKSRLVAELAAGVRDAATVVVGRCVPYGEGITYRPVAELVRQLAGGDPERRLPELLPGDDAAATIAGHVLGVGQAGAAQPDEIAAAIRRLLERAARDRPLVVVVEDVHWAEPTLLDLLEYVAAFSSGAPLLLVCVARPELLDAHPRWAAPQPDRALLVLEPLSGDDAAELVRGLAAEALGRHAAERIVERAEGNPLFLEQLVAAQAESGTETLPPSLHAVLAARIDRLEPGERGVLASASVEGRTFHRGALAELVPAEERADLDRHLVALVRKRLIRADRPELAGDDAFRFAHALVREAAYEGTPKHDRAELHERLADWLATRRDARDEVVGHHLAQACGYRAELGRPRERDGALAAAAAQRLRAGARAALDRGDLPAAARLLERAAGLLAPADPARPALLLELGGARFGAGRLAEADGALAQAEDAARAMGDARLAARARVERALLALQAAPDAGGDEAERVAGAALQTLDGHGDELGQCRAWCLRAWIAWTQGQAARADDAWRRAAGHAERAGDERELFDILCWRASAAVFGPTPVPEAIRRCEEIRERVRGSLVALSVVLHPLAALHAMQGDFDRARRLVREGNAILGELGRLQSAVSHHEALVELLAGEPAAAEAQLRAGYEKLEEMGEHTLIATTAAMLAQAVLAQGRPEEAARFCAIAAATTADDDVPTQAMWRGVRARLLAAEGRAEAAAALARDAVALAERTDFPTVHADARLDLAAVLEGAAAEAAARQALALYEAKGDVVSAGRARARLAVTAPVT